MCIRDRYCIENTSETIRLYGGSGAVRVGADALQSWLSSREKIMLDAIARHPQFHAPTPFKAMKQLADGVIGDGNKMGEGCC